jgi:hypothetical protein
VVRLTPAEPDATPREPTRRPVSIALAVLSILVLGLLGWKLATGSGTTPATDVAGVAQSATTKGPNQTVAADNGASLLPTIPDVELSVPPRPTEPPNSDDVPGPVETVKLEVAEPAEPSIISELSRPVKAYAKPSMRSAVEFELLIGDRLDLVRQVDGWFRVRTNQGAAWVFGAFIANLPDDTYTGFISVDGSTLRPEYQDGSPVNERYRPGHYAFGYTETQDDRTLIFLDHGLVVYIDSAKLRPVR